MCNQQRKLAAILAVDVVGYSSMMEQNETAAFQCVQQLRLQVLEPLAEQFQGHIFKFTGDGAFIEFSSVVDAVKCSLEIQHAVSSKNEKLPEADWIGLRVGVSLGEVIVEGDDLFGNAVNIAARLEGLAEPGTICIAANVREHIGKTLDLEVEDLGDQTVKNISRPIGTFLIRPKVLFAPKQKTPITENSAPSIAILPFQNMSVDQKQEYFADGITEELITAVSQFKQFRVISRNSSFVYKGRSVDIRQVARNLGVRYVLEGSVRRGGNRLRITGQLIEAEGGTHLWADRYDGDLDDIFDLQDRITSAVVGAIEPTIRTAEIERARRTPPENLLAYDLYLQALPHLYAFRPNSNRVATELLHRAIEKDPEYALALAFCAWGYEQGLSLGWPPIGKDDAGTATALARRALATNTDDPMALGFAGLMLILVARDYDRGLSAVRRAESLNPNIAFLSMAIGCALTYSCEDPERALEHLERAIHNSPGDPTIFFSYSQSGMCHFFANRMEQAIDFCNRALDINPDWEVAYWVLVAALVKSGRMDDARIAVMKLRRLNPDATIKTLRQTISIRDSSLTELLLEGLSEAGFPD